MKSYSLSNYRDPKISLKPYYYQGILARLMDFPKSDNPYQGQYKESHCKFTPSREQRKAEWERGYNDQDMVFAGYLDHTE